MKVRLLLLFSVAVMSMSGVAMAQERRMNVRLGPELVFSKSVGQIIPQLLGAQASNENGRVGNELVFWGYQLADNTPAWFFACAKLDNVDCEARLPLICAAGNTNIIVQQLEPGKVRELQCKAVGLVGAGELRPGCVDSVSTTDMLVGMVQCL